MIDVLQERRQAARVPIRAGHVYLRSSWTTVQLLDISLGGVLMSAAKPLEPGRRAGLRTVVGGERVAIDLEIRREEAASGGGGPATWRCAAAFVALDESSRRSLEKFLRRRVSKG